MKPGTEIEVRAIPFAGPSYWEAAKIARQPKGGYPVAGYWAVRFADGGTLAVHETCFRTKPAAEWRFVSAEDGTMDSEYRLFIDGKDARISVQDARSYGGGYCVNREEGEGDDFAIASFGAVRNLRMAKAIGERVWREGK